MSFILQKSGKAGGDSVTLSQISFFFTQVIVFGPYLINLIN